MKSDRVSLTNEVLFWLCMLLLMPISVSSLNEEFKTIAQAPTVFLAAAAWITLFVAGAAWFFIERLYRSKIDTLNERINAKDEELKRKEDLLLERIKPKEDGLAEYKNQLSQCSNFDLSREACQMAKKLRLEAETVIAGRGNHYNHRREIHLHNLWLVEGKRALAIKQEMVKRLPIEVLDSLDRLLDPHYEDSTMDPELVLQAVDEINDLGIELRALFSHQEENGKA